MKLVFIAKKIEPLNFKFFLSCPGSQYICLVLGEASRKKSKSVKHFISEHTINDSLKDDYPERSS